LLASRHDIRWEDYVRPDTSSTSLLWKVIGIVFRIETRRIRTATEIIFREAAIALLHILSQVLRRASHCVASEHAEALHQCQQSAT
jgi:hypothetical protein